MVHRLQNETVVRYNNNNNNIFINQRDDNKNNRRNNNTFTERYDIIINIGGADGVRFSVSLKYRDTAPPGLGDCG